MLQRHRQRQRRRRLGCPGRTVAAMTTVGGLVVLCIYTLTLTWCMALPHWPQGGGEREEDTLPSLPLSARKLQFERHENNPDTVDTLSSSRSKHRHGPDSNSSSSRGSNDSRSSSDSSSSNSINTLQRHHRSLQFSNNYRDGLGLDYSGIPDFKSRASLRNFSPKLVDSMQQDRDQDSFSLTKNRKIVHVKRNEDYSGNRDSRISKISGEGYIHVNTMQQTNKGLQSRTKTPLKGFENVKSMREPNRDLQNRLKTSFSGLENANPMQQSYQDLQNRPKSLRRDFEKANPEQSNPDFKSRAKNSGNGDINDKVDENKKINYLQQKDSQSSADSLDYPSNDVTKSNEEWESKSSAKHQEYRSLPGVVRDVHSNRSGPGVRRLPGAIIIGVKKAGTRALLEFLRVHPDVVAPGPEPHFFDRNYHRGLAWYRSLMPVTQPGQLTVEKTPSYFITREVPRRVQAMSRHIKLLVVVRDPVTRAISDYVQAASKTDVHLKPFEEMALLDHRLGIVNTSWGAVRIGVYTKHLERWFKYFPRSQIHFVSGEELIENPAKVMTDVQEFLSLTPFISDKHFYLNATRGFPCLVKNPEKPTKPHCLGKTKGRRHPDVDPYVIKRLQDFYRPFNSKFYQMVGRDFGWS